MHFDFLIEELSAEAALTTDFRVGLTVIEI